MTTSPISRLVRPAVLVVAGMLLGQGALTVATPGTAPAATQTRIASCSAWDFRALDSATEYAWVDRRTYRIGDSGDGWFACDADLPHRAVVTKVRFTGQDLHASAELEFCGLVRMALGTTGDLQGMAFPIVRSGMDDRPGTIRRTDDSIEFATVDNGRFAYSLQCHISLEAGAGTAGSVVSIIGADVTYTISSANG